MLLRCFHLDPPPPPPLPPAHKDGEMDKLNNFQYLLPPSFQRVGLGWVGVGVGVNEILISLMDMVIMSTIIIINHS